MMHGTCCGDRYPVADSPQRSAALSLLRYRRPSIKMFRLRAHQCVTDRRRSHSLAVNAVLRVPLPHAQPRGCHRVAAPQHRPSWLSRSDARFRRPCLAQICFDPLYEALGTKRVSTDLVRQPLAKSRSARTSRAADVRMGSFACGRHSLGSAFPATIVPLQRSGNERLPARRLVSNGRRWR